MDDVHNCMDAGAITEDAQVSPETGRPSWMTEVLETRDCKDAGGRVMRDYKEVVGRAKQDVRTEE